MSGSTKRGGPEELERLEARVAELVAENERLRGGSGPPEGRSGRGVVLIFFGLMFASMGTAFAIWTAARNTARERDAKRAAEHPPISRIEAAGRAAVHGLHQCVSEAPAMGEVTMRLRVKVAPAGTVGLAEAEVKPEAGELVPCARKVPSNIKLDPDPTAQSPIDVEVLYRQAPDGAGGYEARWSWKRVP